MKKHSNTAAGSPPDRRISGRGIAISCVGGLAVAALGASVLISQQNPSSSQRAAAAAEPTAGASQAPVSQKASASKPIRVGLEPVRFAQYSKATLHGFATTGLVGRVVRGQVSSVDYTVTDDSAHTVLTTYVLQPLNKIGKPQGNTITVTETGGIVPLREVSSDFTDKGATLTPEQLEQPVDFSDGTAHPVVGDTALVFLKHTTGHEYVGLARMTLNLATGEYQWAGEAPNAGWSSTELADQQVETQYSDLIQED